MRIENYMYEEGWDRPFDTSLDSEQTLVILFGMPDALSVQAPIDALVEGFPHATIVGASSAGEIFQDACFTGTVSVAVLCFERTRLRFVSQAVTSPEYSYENGRFIAEMLGAKGLRNIFVLSDGLNVNGSKLVRGLNEVLAEGVVVTGGMAADDDRFEKTWVIVDGEARSNYITAVGFYGEAIHVAYGSKGGWSRLGIARRVTRSSDNILYELDGQPALTVYKRYLGEKASGLPATGLLFPLELQESDADGESKVRTILGVSEEAGSITFAGDIPEGSMVSLMKANFDRLIDGAAEAAESVDLSEYRGEALCSIAISCVGRRLVLKQRTEDELEAVLDALPRGTKQTGFYSYGEISPLASGKCDLHNQTMTLTLIWESDA